MDALYELSFKDPLNVEELKNLELSAQDNPQIPRELIVRAVKEILYLREQAKREDLRRRELQEHNTIRTNEMRMWKARAKHAKNLLSAVLLEYPLVHLMREDLETEIPNVLQNLAKVWKRIELLEKDANIQLVNLVRFFCKEAFEETEDSFKDHRHFIDGWAKRFLDVLQDDV